MQATVFVIAFVAAGCPPCDNFKRDLPAVQAGVEVRVVTIDIAERPDLAQKCGVRSTPTFVAIENERQVSRLVGYTGQGRLREWLSRVKIGLR